VSLPGVGENLQDQPNLLLLNYNKANVTGSTPYSTFITAADLFGRNAFKIAADAKRNLGAWASEISNASDNAVSAEALQHVLSIQHNLAFGREVPSSELLTGAAAFPGVESALLVALWPLIPFSRGTVHIASSDPLQPPAIDPRFFQLDIDLKWAVETARLARRLWETEPMKALVGLAIVPSPKEDAPDAEWEVFVKDICQYLFPLVNISYLELYTLSPLHLCISHIHDGDRLDPSTDAKKLQLPPIRIRSALLR
jgi:choline dehydrogenase